VRVCMLLSAIIICLSIAVWWVASKKSEQIHLVLLFYARTLHLYFRETRPSPPPTSPLHKTICLSVPRLKCCLVQLAEPVLDLCTPRSRTRARPLRCRQVVLAVLLSTFRFRLAEPTASQIAVDADSMFVQLSGVIKPRDGLWMHAEPRTPTARL